MGQNAQGLEEVTRAGLRRAMQDGGSAGRAAGFALHPDCENGLRKEE